MSAVRLLAVAALSAACCTQGKPPPSDTAALPAPTAAQPASPPATPPAAAPAPAPIGDPAPATAARASARPRASGPVTVRGGETIELDGARITIGQLTYLNQPCPPNVQCIHSGVMKLVEFQVRRGAAPVSALIPEGDRRVVDGVALAVLSVRPGPEADVEASLPVAPAR